ncbi:MAG: lamin tail domain-containing protein, partial [Planctomycetota bacterium]
ELGPGQYGLFVRDIAAFQATYPNVPAEMILGEYAGGLRNSGEQIKIDDASGQTIVDLDYSDSDPWSVWADGPGGTLVSVDPEGAPRGSEHKSYSWRSSGTIDGTPGAADPGLPGVVITEILAHTDAPLVDAIELHNPTAQTIDIGGWFLSDDDDALAKYEIPSGTMLPAGGFVVFDESDFNPTPNDPQPNHFALSGSQGETVWLTVASGGLISGLADFATFDATYNGVSVGRIPTPGSRFLPLAERSLGGPNGDYRVPDLYISEVHYHPLPPTVATLAIDSTITESDLEYVEISNRSDESIDLMQYQLRGESEFTFVSDTTLDAGESILLVTFDPALQTNSVRLAAFRNQYGISADVDLAGPLTPSLSNSEGVVRLRAPDDAPVDEPTVTPRVLIDEVHYDDRAPWPFSVDGLGDSLQRAEVEIGGNQPEAWRGVEPTPGVSRLVPVIRDLVVNRGLETRSELTEIQFDVSVPIATPDASAFTLVDADDLPVTAINVVAEPHGPGTRVRLTFGSGIGIVERPRLPNTLADGDYRLSIAAGALVAQIGGAGTENEFLFGEDVADRFFRKYGDSDGDGNVNLLDFTVFRSAFGSFIGDDDYDAALDFQGDGGINAMDFVTFRTNYRI